MPAAGARQRSRRPAVRALARIDSIPWEIRREALEELRRIAARQHDPELWQVALESGARHKAARSARIRSDGVAVVPIQGPIFRHANLLTDFSGATSLEGFAQDFRSVLRDPEVKGVVLDVDSPGGEAYGIAEMADHIARARRGSKPVVAYVGGDGASAAYHLAAGASEVIAGKGSLLGSIGVVMAYVDTRKQDEMLGIEEIEFVSSDSPAKRPDVRADEGKALIQGTVDTLGREMAQHVARLRGIPLQQVLDDFGKGWVLPARQAIKAGLADKLGTFEATVRHVASGRAREAMRARYQRAAT